MTREVEHHPLSSLEFGLRFRKDVDMHVCIADVAEDHVVQRALPQLRVIVGEHFVVARDRDGIVGSQLQESPPAHSVIHQFGQRMTKAAKTFAVLIAGGEPTVFRRVIGPEIDIAILLFD